MPKITIARRLGLVAFALAMFVAILPARADYIGYEFRICENLSVLQSPNNASLQAQAVNVNQQQMSMARDMPYFQLINTSDVTVSLTNFRLTIDPARAFDFDLATLISASPGITYVLNAIDEVQNGLRSKFIDITFTGFTPGKSVIFRTDIDHTTGDVNAMTDYRLVLFTPNSAGTTDQNAKLMITFNNDLNLSHEESLPNFVTNGQVLTCICFRDTASVDTVQPFIVAQAVPEPGVWMTLGLVAVGGVIAIRRRKAA
ncbi:MAG: PEP-CTERM sorting domain-containing protein [Pirellulales bacterium]